MGGGRKKKMEEGAASKSAAAAETERQNAAQLQQQLGQRQNLISQGLPEAQSETLKNAKEFAQTGGFRQSDVDVNSRGYEGYKELATTGGYTPEQQTRFLTKATAPITAMYSATKDSLDRQRALQGGYMPGYTASNARLLRQQSQAGAEAGMNANLELNRDIQAGKERGMAGMASTREAAGREALGIASGRMAGQDSLQKFQQFGVSALNESDITGLRNRLQSGQLSQSDAQLLQTLASQQRTLFQNIMQGIGTVGGAAAGILGAA